jgi:hypothetical protein
MLYRKHGGMEKFVSKVATWLRDHRLLKDYGGWANLTHVAAHAGEPVELFAAALATASSLVQDHQHPSCLLDYALRYTLYKDTDGRIKAKWKLTGLRAKFGHTRGTIDVQRLGLPLRTGHLLCPELQPRYQGYMKNLRAVMLGGFGIYEEEELGKEYEDSTTARCKRYLQFECAPLASIQPKAFPDPMMPIQVLVNKDGLMRHLGVKNMVITPDWRIMIAGKTNEAVIPRREIDQIVWLRFDLYQGVDSIRVPGHAYDLKVRTETLYLPGATNPPTSAVEPEVDDRLCIPSYAARKDACCSLKGGYKCLALAKNRHCKYQHAGEVGHDRSFAKGYTPAELPAARADSQVFECRNRDCGKICFLGQLRCFVCGHHLLYEKDDVLCMRYYSRPVHNARCALTLETRTAWKFKDWQGLSGGRFPFPRFETDLVEPLILELKRLRFLEGWTMQDALERATEYLQSIPSDLPQYRVAMAIAIKDLYCEAKLRFLRDGIMAHVSHAAWYVGKFSATVDGGSALKPKVPLGFKMAHLLGDRAEHLVPVRPHNVVSQVSEEMEPRSPPGLYPELDLDEEWRGHEGSMDPIPPFGTLPDCDLATGDMEATQAMRAEQVARELADMPLEQFVQYQSEMLGQVEED